MIKQRLVLAGGTVLMVSTHGALSQPYPSQNLSQSPAARVYLTNPVALSNAYTCRAGRYTDAVRCNEMYGSLRYALGQVIPAGVGQPIGYAQLTPELRAQYSFDPARDYVLIDSYLLEVDARTRAIRGIIPVQRQR